MTKSKVYFTREVSPQILVKMYDTLQARRAILITYDQNLLNH